MPPDVAGIRLLVGLGNPGPEYERTRHNVGFMVLDRLAADWRVKWERSAKWGAYWAKTKQAILVKPMTYMNRSGGPLQAVSQFYKIEPAEMLGIFDDMDLPLGRLRIRLEVFVWQLQVGVRHPRDVFDQVPMHPVVASHNVFEWLPLRAIGHSGVHGAGVVGVPERLRKAHRLEP